MTFNENPNDALGLDQPALMPDSDQPVPVSDVPAAEVPAVGVPAVEAPAVAVPAAEVPAADAAADVPTKPVAARTPAEERRRRKLIAAGLLGLLVVLFAGFGVWYLINRKPIAEVLPTISQDTVPSFSFSIYGLSKPMGIAVNSSGDRIYVAETGGQRTVHIYDGKGTQVGTFAPPKSTPATRIPVYVALDPLTGDVYVSDRMSASIYIYDSTGAYRRTFTPKVALPGWAPLGLAFDAQGNLYVGNVGKPFHEILIFDRDGALKRTIGQAGQFSFPNGIAVDDKGNVYVADGNNGRVVEIDGTGRQIGGVAHGQGEGDLGLPRGVVIDDEKRLYVVDTTGQGVQVYRLGDKNSLKYVGTAGVEGTGDGQFEYPFGVAADGRGRIYVADWANDRVQVWSY